MVEAIWALLSSQSRQPDDWAIGSLLRLLAADPDQLAKLQATYPEGWLVPPGVGAERCTELQWCLLRGELEEADRLTTPNCGPWLGQRPKSAATCISVKCPACPLLSWLTSIPLVVLQRWPLRLPRSASADRALALALGATLASDRLEKRRVLDPLPRAFTWSHEAPEGHMPLVNQLRGVRLMDAYLRHPAIDQALQAP